MNRHAKVIQQRKIAHLEARLARLEREAGLVDDFVDGVKDLGRKVVNIPKNFIQNLISVLKAVGSHIAIHLSEVKENQKKFASNILEARVKRIIAGSMGLSMRDTPSLVSFNTHNFWGTKFTSPATGGRVETIAHLVDVYKRQDPTLGRALETEVEAWIEDFHELWYDKVDRKGFEQGLKAIKRSSRELYHLIMAVVGVFGISSLLTYKWGLAIYTFVFHMKLFNSLKIAAVALNWTVPVKALLPSTNLLIGLFEKAMVKLRFKFDTKSASMRTAYPNVTMATRVLREIALNG
jgi:hypothetical protein